MTPWPAAPHHAAPSPEAIAAATRDLVMAACLDHATPELRALAPLLAALRQRLAQDAIDVARCLSTAGDAAADVARAPGTRHQQLAWRALATALWQTSAARVLAPDGARAIGQDDGALA